MGEVQEVEEVGVAKPAGEEEKYARGEGRGDIGLRRLNTRPRIAENTRSLPGGVPQGGRPEITLINMVLGGKGRSLVCLYGDGGDAVTGASDGDDGVTGADDSEGRTMVMTVVEELVTVVAACGCW